MADPHCIACEGVTQIAITCATADHLRLPEWICEAAEEVAPLPLILNCPRCGGGDVNVTAPTSTVDIAAGFRLEHGDAA